MFKQLDAKYIQYIAVALIAFLVLASINLAVTVFSRIGNGQRDYQNTISVSASAEVSAMPDVARLSFTVSEEAENADDAQATVKEKTADALAIVREYGVEDKDIETSISVYPRYSSGATICYDYGCDRGDQEIRGYEVSQNVTIELREFDEVGTLLSDLVSVGVRNLNGPYFSIEDKEAAQEEARLEAIAKAKEKARKMSDEIGVRLGKVVNYYENDGGYYPAYRTMNAAYGGDMAVEEAAIDFNVPVAEQDVAIEVTLVYKVR